VEERGGVAFVANPSRMRNRRFGRVPSCNVIRTRRRPARSHANARARMSATSPLVTLSRRCRALAAASTSRAMSPFRSHFSKKFLARVSTVPDVDDERSRSSTMREPSGGKWTKRVIDDVVVMHPDVSRGIEVLHNPIYNKGTSFTGASPLRLEIARWFDSIRDETDETAARQRANANGWESEDWCRRGTLPWRNRRRKFGRKT